jgi:1-acyl-sn-glycerol-3-phosphate acyltransferase
MYRVRTSHPERIPLDGPAVLVCNHVSFVDWFIVFSAIQRPVRFVVYYKFMKLPLANLLMRDAKVIPIAPAKEDKATLDAAYERIAQDLAAGELVCVFPEGEITHDGTLRPFKPGIERIIQRSPVPVIPMGLRGLWGSFFSRKYGAAFSRPLPRLLRRLTTPWPKVELAIGEPVAPEQVTAAGVAERVAVLAGLEPPPRP